MAENIQESESSQQEFPVAGKVQKVCKKWSEHEDGVLAYKLQNEEIDFHYGLNRYNRRTARDDLPVAKEIQDEEEKRHQEERMRQLTLLHQRSQEDEKVAQKVYQEILMEEQTQKKKAEYDDQEIARMMQDKEKRKYERYLEKQRERQLKREREKIEKRLAKQTEEARLSKTDGVEQVGNAMEALNIQNRSGNVRVRSGGQLEDGGDFSDFYVLPDDVSCTERRILQEHQDEELAKLLQEQEHKRTKAIVDQRKLREIETQDARLAEIIQEQEKIKARRTRGRREKAASDVHPGKECQMSGDRVRPRSMAETQTRQSSPSSDTGPPPNRAQHGSASTLHNHSHLVTPTSSSWSRDQEIHSIPTDQLRDREQCPVSPGHSRDQKRHSVPSARSRDREPRSATSGHLRGPERHSVPSAQPRDHESHLVSSGRPKDLESPIRCDQYKDKETNTIPSSFPNNHENIPGQSVDQEPRSVPYSQSFDLQDSPAASPVRSRDHRIHPLSFGHSRDQEPHPPSPDHYRNENSYTVPSGQLLNEETHSGSRRPRDPEIHSVSSGHLRDQEQHSLSSGQLRDQESPISSGRSREQEQIPDCWSRDQEGHSVRIGHSRVQESHSLSSGRSRDQEQHSVSSVQTREPEPHSVSVGRSREQEHHMARPGPHRDTRSHCSIHSNTTGHLRNVESNSSIPPSGRKRNDNHVCTPPNRWSHQEPVSAPSGRRRDQVSNSVPSSRPRDQHYTSHSITHWRDHQTKPNPIIDFEPYFIKPPANLSKDPELHLINSVPEQKRDDSDIHSVPINSALPRDSETHHAPHQRKSSLPGPVKPARTSGPHFATQVKTLNSPHTTHFNITRVTDNSSPGRHLNNPISGTSHPHAPQTKDNLNETDAEEVSRWLTECPMESSPQSGRSRNSQLQEWESDILGQELNSSDRSSRVSGDMRLPSPSPPGSYHSDDEPSSLSSGTPDFTPSKRQISNPISCTYNIATAIDPTYKRRQHEIEAVDETEPKIPLMLSRSLPVHADTELEWDPGVRGSLRRPKVVHWKHMATLRGGTLEEGSLDDEDGLSDGVVTIQGTQFQPVQGQRRTTTMDRSKKLKKPGPKGNTCKQQ